MPRTFPLYHGRVRVAVAAAGAALDIIVTGR